MPSPSVDFLPIHSFNVRLDEIIEQNLSNEDFNVEELARLLFLSPSQVYRKIRQRAGVSTSVYIRNTRLRRAHDLILETDWTISQIAYELAFNDIAYFSRCFSEFYGVPPSTFKVKRTARPK